MTLTADERMTLTRQYLVETDLDAETRSKIHCIASWRYGRHTGQFKFRAVFMVCHSMCWALNIMSLP